MNDIAQFGGFIRALWPSYRCTDEMLREVCRWDTWFSQLRLDYVRQSVKSHRREFPDGTKPEWKDIFRRVANTNREGGQGLNEFEVLLRNVRDAAGKCGNKGVLEWSDEDVWFHFCAANPGCEVALCRRWRTYLRELGQPVPSFLEDSDRA